MATSTSRTLAAAVALCAALAACAAVSPGADPDEAPRIWDLRAGRFITEAQLVADLAGARFRLLGEVHDNPAHHQIRARLVRALAAEGARPAVVFEQFDLDHDAALVAAQAAGADAEQLATAGHFDRKGWIWPLHKPILDAAIALRLPVRAANLPRSELRGDLRAEVERDTGASWYARLHAARWTDAQAAALAAEIYESHCRMLPEALVPRLVLAQRVRDAAMAQALVADATADGAILIAGNGHVRADLGVPVYLRAPGLPGADARTISVGLVEVDADGERGPARWQRVAAETPGFDYLWFTGVARREDPCLDPALTGGAARPPRP